MQSVPIEAFELHSKVKKLPKYSLSSNRFLKWYAPFNIKDIPQLILEYRGRARSVLLIHFVLGANGCNYRKTV